MKKLKEFALKHLSTIKGLGAMLFGVALVYIAHEVFLNLIVFTCGVLLIYYAMVELKLRVVTNFIDHFLRRIRR